VPKAALVWMLAACGGAAAPVAPTLQPPPAQEPSPSGTPPERTAGIYWMPYVTCADCTPPRAIAAYLAPDERSARAIRAALDGKLGLGLPFVVHTDELGLTATHGIAVVIGAFGTKPAAEQVAAASPVIADLRASAVEIAPNAQPPVAPRHVTVVDRGGAVAAWSRADVDAVHAHGGGRDELARQIAQRPAACSVLPGDVFLVDDGDVDWYSFAPVRCGSALAYIPWTQSLLGHAVIVRDGSGGDTLSQVVGAECDEPIIETWRYDAEGRHAQIQGPPRKAGGC
jgi:hypothetical protein